MRRRVRWWLVVLLLAIVAVGYALAFGTPQFLEHRRREAAKQVGDELWMAVARWGFDADGGVPASLDELIQQGYLTALPVNPYTKQPIRILPWGDPPSAGDVTYLPLFYAPKTGVYEGYAIIVHGPPGYRGVDVDGDGTYDRVLTCKEDIMRLQQFDSDGDGVPDTKT